MFNYSESSEEIAEIDMRDADPESFKLMISFFYCRNFSIGECSIQNLIILANRYEADDLITLCLMEIEKNLHSSTLPFWLKFSEDHQLMALQNLCLKYLSYVKERVCESKKYKKLSSSLKNLILEQKPRPGTNWTEKTKPTKILK